MIAVMLAIVSGNDTADTPPRILERRVFPVATIQDADRLLAALAAIAPDHWRNIKEGFDVR